jgi:hypothetical protein
MQYYYTLYGLISLYEQVIQVPGERVSFTFSFYNTRESEPVELEQAPSAGLAPLAVDQAKGEVVDQLQVQS